MALSSWELDRVLEPFSIGVKHAPYHDVYQWRIPPDRADIIDIVEDANLRDYYTLSPDDDGSIVVEHWYAIGD